MRKLLLAGLIALCPLFVFGEQIIISDLSAGIVNNLDSTRIPDNAVSEASNVFFDDEFVASKRKGMTKFNSTAIGDGQPVKSQYNYQLSNGTRYHIVHSSNTVYYRQSGSEFTVLKNQISNTYKANYAVFMDTLTVVDGVNNMWSWDTSTTFTQNSTYQPRYIIVWQNRLWIAGDTTDGLSRVRCSEYLDPSDYTVPATPLATDPAVFDANSQDGQKVMGFFLSPNGNLGILKEKSVWEIGGYDRDDFYMRLTIPDLGCVDSGSVAYKEGVVSWLSEEGFVGYDGNTYKLISDPINGTIADIQQLTAGSGSFIKTSQLDWQENVNSGIFKDITTLPGSFLPDNKIPVSNTEYTRYPNIITNSNGVLFCVYQGGGYLNWMCDRFYSTGTITNTVIDGRSNCGLLNPTDNIAIDSNDIINTVYSYGVKSGSNWTFTLEYATSSVDGTSWSITDIDDAGTWTSGYSPNAAIAIDSNNKPHIIYTPVGSGINVLKYATYNTSWSTYTIDSSDCEHGLSIEVGTDGSVQAVVGDRGTDNMFYINFSSGTDPVIISSNSITSVSNSYFGFDLDSLDNPIISYGNGTDVYVSSSTSGIWTTSLVSNVGRYITELSVASNDDIYIAYKGSNAKDILMNVYNNSGGTWGNDRTVDAEGGGIDDGIDININQSDEVYLAVSKGIVSTIYPSTFTYVSNVFDTGFTAAYYFDSFLPEQVNAGQNIYSYFRSSNTSSGILGENWTVVNPGSVPSLNPYQYIQYKCVMSSDIPVSTNSNLQLAQLNYHGSAGSTFLSSMNFDGRIYNAVGISSSTYLDRQLVWDWNGSWADMTSAIGCSSLLNYSNTPYWGSDDGYIYTMESGDSDDGSPINAYFKTKAYTVSDPIRRKTLNRFYILAGDSGDWNLTANWYFNRSEVSSGSDTMNLTGDGGIRVGRMLPTTQLPFYTVQFEISNRNANQPFDFLGLQAELEMLPLE